MGVENIHYLFPYSEEEVLDETPISPTPPVQVLVDQISEPMTDHFLNPI